MYRHCQIFLSLSRCNSIQSYATERNEKSMNLLGERWIWCIKLVTPLCKKAITINSQIMWYLCANFVWRSCSFRESIFFCNAGLSRNKHRYHNNFYNSCLTKIGRISKLSVFISPIYKKQNSTKLIDDEKITLIHLGCLKLIKLKVVVKRYQKYVLQDSTFKRNIQYVSV